jgi:hypothetical protein
MAAAYITGSKYYLGWRGGNISYEFSKYGVMFFVFIGMYFSGSSKGNSYWIFLLLVPSIVISTFVLDFDTNEPPLPSIYQGQFVWV